MTDIVVTGIGVISPIGNSPSAVVESLQNLRSGIGLFESPMLDKRFAVGRVPEDFSERFTRIERPFLDRTTQLAIVAAENASKDAGVEHFADYGERAGVFYGTVRGGGATEWEAARQFYVERKPSARPYVIMNVMANAPTAQISIRQRVTGPTASHTSACSSSGNAIADACRHLQCGELDIALVGGAEATLEPGFLWAWDGLRALAAVDEADPSRSCKPFSTARTGLVLGEGSVFFVLESREHAQRRGARIHAVIKGWGVASDAYHIGSPHARGQIAAMRAALRKADLAPAELDYINAHATATRGGDPVEVSAMKEVLGDAAVNVPISGTKALHGHLLGAASAMEALVCILAIEHGFLPGTAHLDDLDPECEGLHHLPHTLMGREVRHALTLSAGFGGTNVALVLGRS